MHNDLIMKAIGYPLFVLAGLEFFLTVMLTRRLERKQPLMRSAILMLLVSGLWALAVAATYTAASMGANFDYFYRACWIGWFLMVPGLQFAYYLEDENSRMAMIIGFIFYPFWFIVNFLNMFTNYIEIGAKSVYPFVDLIGPLETPTRLVGIFLVLFMLVKAISVRRHLVGLQRQRVDLFLVGVVICAVGTGALMVGTQIAQALGGNGFDRSLSVFFSVPWVLLTYYALTRYRLFDIQLAISRGVSFIAALVMAAAVQVLLFAVLEPIVGQLPAVFLSLPPVGLLILWTPLIGRLQGYVNKLVLKGKYDYQTVLQQSIGGLTKTLDIDELFGFIVGVVRDTMDPKGIGFLAEQDGSFVAVQASGVDLKDGAKFLIEAGTVRWLINNPRVYAIEEREKFKSQTAFNDLFEVLAPFNATVVVPFTSKERLYGILVISERKSMEPYGQRDIDLLELLGNQAAIAAENAMLFTERQDMYLSVVSALAEILDTRDHYTMGHSERVAEYAIDIGREIGLTESEIAGLETAALLHDIGKIGIPDSILQKPEMLSNEELDVIRTHPESGAKILKPVKFPWDIVTMVYQNHERFDGSGYPNQIAGESIHINARIVHVADSYEAMISDRPYRRALSKKSAAKELAIGSGTRFDPEVVSAMLNVIRKRESTLEPRPPAAIKS